MINYSSKVVPLLKIITISILIIVITPNSGKAQCLRNFPSLQQIRSPSRPLVSNPTGRQYLFPSIEFKCDTSITKIIYKGDVWRNSSSYPVIQLYEEGPVPIFADYLLEQKVEFNELSLVEQGDSGTVILTPKSPIEVDDDSVLGIYLPANSTSFLFEDNPLHSLDIYYENSSIPLPLFNFILPVRQQGLVPLITVETMTSTSTVSPSTTMSSSSTTTIITSTSRYETSTHRTTITNTSTNMPNNIIQTISNVPLTKTSSNTPLVSSTIQTMTISSSSTSNNNTVYPATVSITNLASEPPAVRTTNNYHIPYWVIIVTVVGCVIMIFLLSFMTVICVLTYRLKRAKYELEIRHNSTQQHSRQAQDSVYMTYTPGHVQLSNHRPRQNTQEHETSLQCNSMVFNEAYAYGNREQYDRLTRDIQQYNHLTRPVGIPRSNTCHCLDENNCQSNSPGGIFSMSLSFPNGFQQLLSQAIVPNQIYDNNIHHYEDPDMYLAPRNYERPTYTRNHILNNNGLLWSTEDKNKPH